MYPSEKSREVNYCDGKMYEKFEIVCSKVANRYHDTKTVDDLPHQNESRETTECQLDLLFTSIKKFFILNYTQQTCTYFQISQNNIRKNIQHKYSIFTYITIFRVIITHTNYPKHLRSVL